MIASRARRHPLVLIALALCLLVSPALTRAAELHELVHELSGEHALDGSGHHHHDAGSQSDDDGDSDAGDPVHLLVHCVHTCGGSLAGTPSAAVAIIVAIEMAADLPAAAPVADAPVSLLLRPPRTR